MSRKNLVISIILILYSISGILSYFLNFNLSYCILGLIISMSLLVTFKYTTKFGQWLEQKI